MMTRRLWMLMFVALLVVWALGTAIVAIAAPATSQTAQDHVVVMADQSSAQQLMAQDMEQATVVTTPAYTPAAVFALSDGTCPTTQWTDITSTAMPTSPPTEAASSFAMDMSAAPPSTAAPDIVGHDYTLTGTYAKTSDHVMMAAIQDPVGQATSVMLA